MGVVRHQLSTAKTLPGLGWNLSAKWPWSYQSRGSRDMRLDLIRGFCVFAMIVDHIGGESWLYWITGGNRFFASAAEGFVFISGLVLGSVSVQRLQREGLSVALWAILRRAWTLYLLTVVLTLGFAAYVTATGLPWGWDFEQTDLLEIVVSTLTLHRTFYLIDVLLLYTLLMLTAPIALLFLVRGRAKALLFGSWLLWTLYQFYPEQARIPWPIQGGDMFPMAAWQALFTTGLVLGYHRGALARNLRSLRKGLYVAVVAVLFGTLVLMNGDGTIWMEYLAPGSNVALLVAEPFDKASLAPGRIAADVIVLQFAHLVATVFWKPLRAVFGGFLLPLGQNALFAYVAHVVVVAVVLSSQMERVGYDQSVAAINTWVQFGAAGLIWLLIKRRILFQGVLQLWPGYAGSIEGKTTQLGGRMARRYPEPSG